MFETVLRYCQKASEEFERIPEARRKELTRLAQLTEELRLSKPPGRLTFICTHNSRRSHFGQVWGKVAAHFYGFDDLATYSGGTEATAVHPNTAASLARAGLVVKKADDGPNPKYQISYSGDRPDITCFSKVYDAPSNPKEDFIALMTCSDANSNCPFVEGATHRLPLTYEDPKRADNTSEVGSVYDATCAEVAREMLFTFSLISKA